MTAATTLRVERKLDQNRTSYRVLDEDGAFVMSLNSREVMALVAASRGRVRARWHRTYSPWFYDRHLRPECDDHGIGYGTLTGLQARFGRPGLIAEVGEEEGPLGLTALGECVLAGIAALGGVQIDSPSARLTRRAGGVGAPRPVTPGGKS